MLGAKGWTPACEGIEVSKVVVPGWVKWPGSRGPSLIKAQLLDWATLWSLQGLKSMHDSLPAPLSHHHIPKELIHRKHNGRPGVFSGGAWMTRGLSPSCPTVPILSHYSKEPCPGDHHPITPTHGRNVQLCCMKPIIVRYTTRALRSIHSFGISKSIAVPALTSFRFTNS